MKLLPTLTIFTAMLLTVACGGSRSHSADDFTQEIYTPHYAAGFSITGIDGDASTLITVRNPWQGAAGVEQQLLLLREGEHAPKGFTGQVVKAPIRHAVCMSSSHVAMFDAIGQVRRVNGVSGIDYISNKHVQEHRLCGEVRDVGYDTNINFELLAAMRPDIVLLYGVTGENTLVSNKLRELGIPYMYVGEYVEEDPLGKAEWMVAVAEMCNCREEGEHIFATIRERYETIKAAVPHAAVRPKVMLNTPYRDTWFMPSSRSYMIRLVEDAGGEYIYKDNDGDSSVAVDLEQAYLLANSADVWLNVGAVNTLGELTSQNPKFASAPAVAQQKVYNNNARQTPAGGSDFWESGVVRPDRILEELTGILQGSDEGLYYYKKLR